MSRCGSNTSGWIQAPSQNCFIPQPQFLNIPGMAPYAPQKCNKTCSSPCCSPYQFGSGTPQQFRPMMAAPSRTPMMPMGNCNGNGHPNVNGIRLRCPSCCRPIGSCTCGCCKCASKTYY